MSKEVETKANKKYEIVTRHNNYEDLEIRCVASSFDDTDRAVLYIENTSVAIPVHKLKALREMTDSFLDMYERGKNERI